MEIELDSLRDGGSGDGPVFSRSWAALLDEMERKRGQPLQLTGELKTASPQLHVASSTWQPPPLGFPYPWCSLLRWISSC